MGEVLDLIRLCPCGAPPEPGSDYCGYDCTPTHLGPDTTPHGARVRTGWDDQTDPWAHLGRTITEQTDPVSRRLADWLRMHNIDPATVLAGAPILVTGEGITVTTPVYDLDGTVQLDPGDRRIVLTEEHTYPLITVERAA